MSFYHNLHVTAGVIDADYTGSVFVLMFNGSARDVYLAEGSKIAQLILEKYSTPVIMEVAEITPTTRGTAAIGSTGR